MKDSAARVLLLSLSVAAISCEESSKKTSDAAATGQLVIATDFNDMGLSTALSTDIPAAMKGQGEEAVPGATGTIDIVLPSLRKAERVRSIESCEIRRSVKSGLNILREMAQEICYIEAGGKSFKPNGKFKVSYDEDGYQGDYAVWIDDTVLGKRRISFCANGSLRYIFDLDAANAGLAKGQVTRINGNPEDADGETWAVVANFDRGVSKTGLTELDIRGDYSFPWGSSHERLFISFEEKGLALVAESKVGETPLDDGLTEQWTTQSAALMALNLGSVINRYSTKIKDSEDPADSGAYRAYFDGQGYALAAEDSLAWQSGGSLYVEPKLMPRLPDWATIALPADAWDCSGTTDIVPDGNDAHYAQCDAMRIDWADEDCEDESIYSYSGDTEVIGDDQVSPTDRIDWGR